MQLSANERAAGDLTNTNYDREACLPRRVRRALPRTSRRLGRYLEIGLQRSNFPQRCHWAQLYSHAALRAALIEVLGERKFGESQNRLVIPTYDAIGGRVYVLKTTHHERFKYDFPALAADVALATSAAPTYFEAATFPVHEGSSFVDGGVWANSPVLAAIVEAVCFLGVPLDQIDVLSIGTTSAPFNIAKNRRAGIIKWNAGIINLMFEAQAEATLAQARLLLQDRLHRIDVVTLPGQFSLDDARSDKFEQLINLGHGEAVKKHNLQVLRGRFLAPKAPPFIPIYTV